MPTPLLVQHRDVPLHWYEAVALVCTVADALESGRLRSVPPASELALENDGSLHLTTGAAKTAPQSGSVTERMTDGLAEFLSELPQESGAALHHPARRSAVDVRSQEVARLRELLEELLPADAPPQLRVIAEDKATGTLAEFRAKLAFFQRPNSKADCRAVAERLIKVHDERVLEDEVERLRRKARAEDDPPADRQAATSMRRTKKMVAVAALVAACGVGVIAALVVPGVGTPETDGANAQNATRTPVIERLRAAAASVLGTSENPKPAVAAPAKDGDGTTRPAAGRKPGKRTTSAFVQQPVVEAPTIADRAVLPPLGPLPAPRSAGTPPGLTLPSDVGVIFGRHDADVQPPRLVRPHLPTAESVGLPSGHVGRVEVVVDTGGAVEQVRLISTTAERRYYDIMILSAIKAWIFRPAIKSGQPVRYRLTIPLV